MITIRTTPRPECPECFSGTDYCPQCGEKKHSPEDFTIRKFFTNIFQDFTDIDAKFFKTLVLLTFRPGFLSSEFSRGAHAHYIKPFRLFVMVALIHFLAFGLSSSIDIFNMNTVNFLDRFGLYSKIMDLPALAGFKPVYTDTAQINREIKNILSLTIYIVLFIMSGYFYLLFKNRKQYYTEHLVFIFHIISAAFLRNFLLIPFFWIYKPFGIFLAVSLNFVYVVTALRNFYGLSTFRAILTLFPTAAILAFQVYFLMITSAVLAVYF